MISFSVTAPERKLIQDIVDRAIDELPFDSTMRVELQMDLTACHANGNPLDLEALLTVDRLTLAHDLGGIRRHLDRDTGKLKDFFSPRMSRRSRPLSQIARECRTSMLEQAQGLKKPKTLQQAFPYAYPYLSAMLQLHSVEQDYGMDSGRSVVLYFLASVGTWKGETARRLKAELNALAK